MKTYPLTPNKITQTALSYYVKKVEFEEASYIQKISTRRTPKISFRVEHYALNFDNENIITDFFTLCNGSLGKFRFYNYLDNKYYKCCFSSDILNIERINSQFCNISLELETC